MSGPLFSLRLSLVTGMRRSHFEVNPAGYIVPTHSSASLAHGSTKFASGWLRFGAIVNTRLFLISPRHKSGLRNIMF